MQRDDLIQMDDKKEINLIKEGERLACDIAFRHNLVEYFLCNTLGIPWYEVHKHAHQLEHAMTPTVVDKLAAFQLFRDPSSRDADARSFSARGLFHPGSG